MSGQQFCGHVISLSHTTKKIVTNLINKLFSYK
jgi:hypothetical protein